MSPFHVIMSAKVYEESKLKKDKLLEYGEQYEMDKTDKKILKLLNDNARQSLAEMSRKSGLTRDVIRYRIQKLEENKVILGFRPIINAPGLGFPMITHVYFLLTPESLEQEEKFISFLKGLPHVIRINSLVGKWEFRITIVAKDPSHFHGILKEIRMKFPDLIKDFETMTMLEEYKHWDFSGLFY